MAIYAYVGLPRNGKSYNVVAEQIIPALKDGRRVVTNIPLKVDALRSMGAVGEVVQVDQDELVRDPGVVIERDMTAGSLVVLDELWRFLPQGVTANKTSPAWKSLFAEHGHRVDESGRMMQIVLVTQDLSQVAAFARTLVERTFVVTKLTAIGVSKKFRVDVYAGNVNGLKPTVSKRISEQFGTYDPRIFECYVSRTMAEGSSGTVNESTLDKRASGLRHPMVRYGLPVAALLLLAGLWKAYQFFFVAPAEAAEAGRVANAAKLAASPRAGQMQPRVSLKRYRISGVVRAADDRQSKVLLDYCDGVGGRVVAWQSARCYVRYDGAILCEYDGDKLEFHGAAASCRYTNDGAGNPEIRWFPADAGGSREPVSVVAAKPVDGGGG